MYTWLLYGSALLLLSQSSSAQSPPVIDTAKLGFLHCTVPGEEVTVWMVVSDPDGEFTDTLYTSALPAGAVFVDSSANGSFGHGALTWTPDTVQIGTQFITFYADDGTFIDSELVELRVLPSKDPGLQDSVRMQIAVQPNDSASQLSVALELYVFSDSLIRAMTMGFSWDNPDLQMDSAVASPEILQAFDLPSPPAFFEGGLLAITNFNHRFKFGAQSLDSTGLIGDGSGFRLWATYYFTLSQWSPTDSIIVDTNEFNSTVKFLSVSERESSCLNSYQPVWGGAVTVKDASGVVRLHSELPQSFSLAQNYPNPFNPSTAINFDLPTRSSVRLDVFNLLGRHVRTLVDEELGSGSYVVDWDGTADGGESVSSGVYFYRLTAGSSSLSRKMLLLK